jgi:hypothetical protein
VAHAECSTSKVGTWRSRSPRRRRRYDRLPALAAELVRRKVAAIFIGGSTPAALAVKAATATIPIVTGVLTIAADPGHLGGRIGITAVELFAGG